MGEQAACRRRVFGKFCLSHPHPDADIWLWRCRPLPVKLRRAAGAILGAQSAGRRAPRVAQPRRTGAQRVIFGVPRPRARGPPALPLPGPGAGPFPGREPLGVGGAGDIAAGFAIWGGGTFAEGAAWVLRSQCRAPAPRAAVGAAGRAAHLGLGGELDRLFSRSPPAAVPRCRKRRRVPTCALILSAAGLRRGSAEGPARRWLRPTRPEGRALGSRRGATSLRRSSRSPLLCKLFSRPPFSANSIKPALKGNPAFTLGAPIMCLV